MKNLLVLTSLALFLNPAPLFAANPRITEAAVAVSAANYRSTPREDLVRAVDGSRAVFHPAARDIQPVATPQHFIFMAGESFPSDLNAGQLNALLTPALAHKGYLNAADADGRIAQPEKVTLVLRVSHGSRPWRLPTVRTEGLTWRDGMIPQPRGNGLHRAGGETLWDQRAGGRNALLDARGNVTDFDITRDFHLLVIDAFDYRELKQHGTAAKRLWSTFVSTPQLPGESFSRAAAALVRSATPYFGETTPGLHVFPEARGEVRVGEPRVTVR